MEDREYSQDATTVGTGPAQATECASEEPHYETTRPRSSLDPRCGVGPSLGAPRWEVASEVASDRGSSEARTEGSNRGLGAWGSHRGLESRARW